MKENRKNILVPYNFDNESQYSLENTYNIAKYLNANIVILHVVEVSEAISKFLKRNEQLSEFENEIKKKLEKITEKAKKDSGLNVSFLMKRGKVHKQIKLAADEVEARFIVINKTVSTDSERQLLSSNATRIIRESSVPVITMNANNKCKLNYKNILLPLDLTKRTREKLFNAISFAMHYEATIRIVSVLMGGIKARKSRIYKKMTKVQKIIEEGGINCTTKLFKKTDKPIHQVVLDYGAHVNADLIIIMTHQESNTKDNYIGAFANQIINEAEVPVLSLTHAAAEGGENNVAKTMLDPLKLWK